VVGRATKWLAAPPGPRGGDGPRFLWVHLFDPHMPYVPHDGATPLPGDATAQELPEVSWPRLVALAGKNDGRLPAAVLTRARSLYDGEVSFADRWIGALLDALDARPGRPPAIVALTADHGECFDHGIFFEHSDCLYDGAVHVPLIVRGGRAAAGTRIESAVENLALAPTLLALAGVAVPPPFAGRSRLPGVEGAPGGGPDTAGAAFIQHPVYAPQSAENRLRRQDEIRFVGDEPVRPLRTGEEDFAVRTARWKYIVSGAEEELYDLGADPAEARNVAPSQAAVRGELGRALQAWRAAHPMRAAPAAPLTEEQKQTLRSLGYLQ